MKDAKGHGSDARGGVSSQVTAVKPLVNMIRPPAAHQEGVQDVGQPKPEMSGGIGRPLDPTHQHFEVYVDQGYGTRRSGNDPLTTIGAKSLSEARAAWKAHGSPSQTAKFRLSRIK